MGTVPCLQRGVCRMDLRQETAGVPFHPTFSPPLLIPIPWTNAIFKVCVFVLLGLLMSGKVWSLLL